MKPKDDKRRKTENSKLAEKEIEEESEEEEEEENLTKADLMELIRRETIEEINQVEEKNNAGELINERYF